MCLIECNVFNSDRPEPNPEIFEVILEISKMKTVTY